MLLRSQHHTFERIMERISTPTPLTITVCFITLHVQVMTAALHVQPRLRALSYPLPGGTRGEQHLEGGVMVVECGVQGRDIFKSIVHYCALLQK